MRISGTEPSTVIFSRREQFKKNEQLCPKNAKNMLLKAKSDGVIKIVRTENYLEAVC